MFCSQRIENIEIKVNQISASGFSFFPRYLTIFIFLPMLGLHHWNLSTHRGLIKESGTHCCPSGWRAGGVPCNERAWDQGHRTTVNAHDSCVHHPIAPPFEEIWPKTEIFFTRDGFSILETLLCIFRQHLFMGFYDFNRLWSVPYRRTWQDGISCHYLSFSMFLLVHVGLRACVCMHVCVFVCASVRGSVCVHACLRLCVCARTFSDAACHNVEVGD